MMFETFRKWKLFCAGFILIGAGILMLCGELILLAQDGLPDPIARVEATCNGAPLPPGMACCRVRLREWVYDPATHGCCNDGTYNKTTQGCCKGKLTYTKGPGVLCCSTLDAVALPDGTNTWQCVQAIAMPPERCCKTVATLGVIAPNGVVTWARFACEVKWDPRTQCCCKTAQVVIAQPCVMP